MREDWIEVELRDTCEKVEKVKRKDLQGSFIYLDIGSINNQTNKIVGHKVFNWETAPSRAQQIVHQGDILFSTVRTYLKNIAQVTKTEYHNQICSSGFTVIRGKSSVLDSRFIFYLSIHEGFIQPLNKLQTGSSYPAVRDKDVFAQKIPLPPLPEQRAIVAKIEQLLSGLDAGIESLKKAEAQLKTYRQAVLKKAFEGELTKGWRAQQSNLPTAEALLEQIKEERAQHYAQQLADWAQAVKTWEAEGKEGKKPAKPQKPKEVAPLSEEELKQLPNLPEGWGWCKIGEVGSVGTGSTPKRGNSKYWTNGTIPWITSGALNNEYVNTCKEYVTEIALEETNIKFFPKHTLLVAMYGEGKTRGKCAELLFEATTNQAIAGIVQTGKEKEVRKYLKAFLVKNYQEIRRKSSGGVQPNINLDIVKNTLFPLCSLPEQQQIVQEIETRLSVCDQVEASIQTGLAKAEALRQSILKKAFEGRLLSEAELATCKNEKDWAPASTLLAQIEAEKAEAAAKAPQKASKKTKKKKSVK